MLKKWIAGLVCLALAVSFTACGAAPDTKPGDTDAAGTRTITDGDGRTVEVPEQVTSAACVGVGALRYSCYMGAQDRIVAVEDYETKANMSRMYNYVNFDRFQNLPVIGTNGEPFVEELIRVSPQVIVMSRFASVDADELQQKTGIPVVIVPGSDTLLDDDAFRTLQILGELYGEQQRQQELTDYLKKAKQDLQSRTADISEKPTVYVGGVSFRGHHGFEGTEAGYGPFALIGAENLADTTGQTGPFNIDPEQVLAWDPQVIFVDYNGLELIRADYEKNPGYYDALTAVREGRVYAQISFRSSASNLDTALADAYYAGKVLYPDRFADIDIDQKTGEIFTTLLGADPYPDLKEAGYEFGVIDIRTPSGS